jgi:alpha-glucosidase
LRQSLDGFSGSITRLRNAYDALNQVRPYAQPPNSLIEAWQTGDRLSYRPETVRAELARFPRLFATALADTATLVTTTNPRVEQALKDPGTSAATRARVEQYQPTLRRAQILLEDGKPQRP